LSPPDAPAAAASTFAAFLRDPADARAPVFDEPWQAQAFALVVQLHAAGAFSWSEWADALAAEIRSAGAGGAPDDGSHYYDYWLAALERLVISRGVAAADALAARKDEWAEAYRRTPHGKPVAL
jgi:nitrile hydratase accessory protein